MTAFTRLGRYLLTPSTRNVVQNTQPGTLCVPLIIVGIRGAVTCVVTQPLTVILYLDPFHKTKNIPKVRVTLMWQAAEARFNRLCNTAFAWEGVWAGREEETGVLERAAVWAKVGAGGAVRCVLTILSAVGRAGSLGVVQDVPLLQSRVQ